MTSPRQLLGKKITQSQINSFFVDYMGVTNVKSYGCVGDGVTNDTSNLNVAMADASTNSAGAIYYPPGTYLVTSASLSSNFDNLYHWGDNASFDGSTTVIAQLGNWIKNSGSIPELASGLYANRPSATTTREGYIYICHDTAQIYRCSTDADWDVIASYYVSNDDAEIGRIYKVWW